MSGRSFLAFDYGTRKIGVAYGQRVTGSAQGIAVVPVHPTGPDWSQIERLLDAWRPDAFVVGLPLAGDGTETATSGAARRFGAALGKRYTRPVYWANEHLSTVGANTVLRAGTLAGGAVSRRRRAGRDSLAAELVLTTFLAEPPA